MVQAVRHLLHTILAVARAVTSLGRSAMRSRARLAAENLFLRKQLALYQERKAKARRADDATRLILAGLCRFLAWRQLLVIVKPQTLIRWHRQGFGLFWRWKSRTRGRPPIHPDVQRLIATMAAANRTWGEERIANELLLKAGHPIVASYGAAIHAVTPAAPEEGDPSVVQLRSCMVISGAISH